MIQALNFLLDKYWYAPQDSFQRAKESFFWQNFKMIPPILDIGCGDCKIGKFLFKKGLLIDVGIDVDSYAILKTRKVKIYKKLLKADASKMPFSDNSFRTVISNSTLEHIKNDIKVVSEVSRILKTGGLFAFTTTTSKLEKLLAKELSKKGFNQLNERLIHLHYRSQQDWQLILEKQRLKVLKINYYFSKKDVLAWLRLFQIATFKPNRRELWSYLSDPRFEAIIPINFIKKILYNYLSKFFREKVPDKNGYLMFLIAQKKDENSSIS